MTPESDWPRAKPQRPDEMEPDIAVAEREPALFTEPLGLVQRAVRLVPDAPAAALVEQAGERVEHRVEIRRHVQAEELEIVADVADGRH